MKKQLGLTVFTIIFTIVVLVFTLPYVPGINTKPNAEQTLGIAGLIVAGATLASVMFAAITYVESVVLSQRMNGLALEYTKVREDAEMAMRIQESALRNQLFTVSESTISTLYSFAQRLPEDGAFESLIRSIKEGELQLHLAHGTSQSALIAMQIAMKEHPKRLLSIESAIREIATQISQEERARLLSELDSIRKRAVDMLEYYGNVPATSEDS